MYSNDTNQISQGFDNFIGALISSLHASPEASKQAIVEILCKKIMNLIVNDNEIDLYVARPYIKSVLTFLCKRKDSLTELSKSEAGSKNKKIDSAIDDYNQVIQFFNNILVNTGGEKINDITGKA